MPPCSASAAMTVRVEGLDQRFDFQPRPAEHQRRDRILHVENAGERRRLVRAIDDVGDLPDARHLAGGGFLARDRHARRILQVPIGNRQNPRRHRRREERRLARLGRRLQDGVEILGEAHVEHLVGLVEHEHLQRVELERAAPHVIERAARRGDDDVRAALERADLLMHRRAAVERQHRQARRPSRTCAPPRRPASPARASAPARGPRVWRGRRLSVPPMRCSIGSANAAVLPVPVSAWPSRSRPSSSSGMASRWTGVGSS